MPLVRFIMPKILYHFAPAHLQVITKNFRQITITIRFRWKVFEAGFLKTLDKELENLYFFVETGWEIILRICSSSGSQRSFQSINFLFEIFVSDLI